MPVVKVLPERPKNRVGITDQQYIAELEKYVDALENWIDLQCVVQRLLFSIECFNTGADDAAESKPFTPVEKQEFTNSILTSLCFFNEKEVKEFITHKYPHGNGLYE